MDEQPTPDPVAAAEDGNGAPFRMWQALAVVGIVALYDLVVYRGHGYAGWAAMFVGTPALMCVARNRAVEYRSHGAILLIAAMLLLIAVRLFWYGSALPAVVGFALLAAFAMTLSGERPYVLEGLAFVSQTIAAGYTGLSRQWRVAKPASPTVSRSNVLAILLPAAALLGFGLLFVLANPDLAATFGERVANFASTVREWLVDYAPTPVEVLLWIAVAWITVGALRPITDRAALLETIDDTSGTTESSPLYPACRNTLVAVIALFAIYLVFEFQTLWFREFPKGFHYSGYAHEGAFWLTVALALTTAILSFIFRAGILADPRQHRLKQLAWLWSFENLLLAVAVYHRLLIYVGFNGMTRMRVVGFCGISAVVVGFLLVLSKIASRRDFLWLVRRQLLALFCFVFLYAVLPVDAIVMRYNVARILDGDPAPCVQISVHPIDPDGLIEIAPLMECDDPIIREGVSALLAEHKARVTEQHEQQQQNGWTAFQWAERELRRKLEEEDEHLKGYRYFGRRERAWDRFQNYAYQWY